MVQLQTLKPTVYQPSINGRLLAFAVATANRQAASFAGGSVS